MENNDQEIIYIALNGEELFKHSKANLGLTDADLEEKD